MKRRPSNLARMALCPACIKLCELIGWNGEESEDAASGTACHSWIATGCTMIATGQWQDDADRAHFAEQMTAAGLDSSERWAVWSCVDHAKVLIDKYTEMAGDDGLEVLIEHHVPGDCIGLPDGGTVDLLLVCPFRFAVAVDWKTGRVDQGRAANHDQLRGYATMVAAAFTTETVYSHMFQPRIEDEDNRATSAVYAADALHCAETWCTAVVARTHHKNPQLCAGYSQCLYCEAMHRCPACEEWIVNLLEATEIIQAQNPGRVAELYDAAKLAAKRKDTIAAWIKDQLEKDPSSCPGLRLKPGTTIREVHVPTLFEAMRDHGLGDKFFSVVSASQSKLKEEVPNYAKDLLKAEGVLREIGTRAPTIAGD